MRLDGTTTGPTVATNKIGGSMSGRLAATSVALAALLAGCATATTGAGAVHGAASTDSALAPGHTATVALGAVAASVVDPPSGGLSGEQTSTSSAAPAPTAADPAPLGPLPATATTSPDGGTASRAVSSPPDSLTRPAQAGRTYVGSFVARATAGPSPLTATLTWYDASGAPLPGDTVRSAAVQDSDTQWTEYSVAGLVPPTATTVQLRAVGADTSHTVKDLALGERPQGSTRIVGPLTTRGNTVRDATGEVVVLRGLNRPGLTDGLDVPQITEKSVAKAKSWGANVIRLPLHEGMWLEGCNTYDAGYAARVDQVVRWVTSRGMVAVLDLHVVAPTCSSGALNPMPTSQSVIFWRTVATRYRDQPLVAFELYNEPYGVSSTTWRDGGPARATDGTPYQAVGMQTLYQTIRLTGAQNLVLVDGLDRSSSMPSTGPFPGTNLVWSVHAYTCDVPWVCRSNDVRPVLRRFTTVGLTMPVMVTEFGHPAAQSANATTFNQIVVDFAQQHGWSWSAWAWDNGGTCAQGQYFSLVSTTSCASGTGTFEPSPAGIPLLTALTRIS